jgi:hypothetical protein
MRRLRARFVPPHIAADTGLNPPTDAVVRHFCGQYSWLHEYGPFLACRSMIKLREIQFELILD